MLLLKKLQKSFNKSPHPSIKLTTYFPAYVEMFGHLVNKKPVFIETGVLDGGSLFMWRSFFGPNCRIIGIDLNPSALKWKKSGFEIFIGDQGDPKFLKKILKKIGQFDAFLDDGGHQSFQQIVTVTEAIKRNHKNCIIAIEDTATSFMKDFNSHKNFSFLQYAKSATDILAARTFGIQPNRFPKVKNTQIINDFKNVYKITFYNGIVAFHINQNFSKNPTLIRNKPSSGTVDFRYSGVNSAIVSWPLLTRNKLVTIKGTSNKFNKYKKILLPILPQNLQTLLKKIIKLILFR